jgi:acetolactate synthase-1/2/3 large subunit
MKKGYTDMKVSDYIVDFLVRKGVTDVFGIPGGVVLDFLDSVGKRNSEIRAVLNYNEQASALAACGYAQVAGKLAVAYATRGPGVTNMITGIVDSYRDSLPVLFITAHSRKETRAGIRAEENQEFNAVKMLSAATKYAVSVERADDVRYELEKACYLALNGRPGPVLVDFLTDALRSDITPETLWPFIPDDSYRDDFSSIDAILDCVNNSLGKSKRPVLLLGDGVRLSGTAGYLELIVKKWNIPILSSRVAQDVIPDSKNYYGYIGSHATRYSNFILSKCDLIISLGNRLMFRPDSKSFGALADRAKIIRVDVDKNEFLRKIPNAENFIGDLREIMPALIGSGIEWRDGANWGAVCKELKENLYACDTGYPVNVISDIIKSAGSDAVITSDVGNNELWLSRAYAFSGASNRLLFSKTFGTLGCSLPKATGACRHTGKRVLCFAGDQGLLMNMQEMLLIAKENLPVSIIALNNFSSGMIRDEQERKFDSRFLCTTPESGYGTPDFKKLADAFGIRYFCCDGGIDAAVLRHITNDNGPVFVEISVKERAERIPYLPAGYAMQNLAPEIDSELYTKLRRL